jgi:hypothetical protein
MSWIFEKEQTSFDAATTISGSLAGLDSMIADNVAEVPVVDYKTWATSGIVPAANTGETYTPQYEDGQVLNTDIVERYLGNIRGGLEIPARNNEPVLEDIIDYFNQILSLWLQ